MTQFLRDAIQKDPRLRDNLVDDVLSALEKLVETVISDLKYELEAQESATKRHFEVAREAVAELRQLKEAVNEFPMALLCGGLNPDGTRFHQYINLVTKTSSTHYSTVAEAILAGHQFYKQNPVGITEMTTVTVGIPPTPGPEECDG